MRIEKRRGKIARNSVRDRLKDTQTSAYFCLLGVTVSFSNAKLASGGVAFHRKQGGKMTAVRKTFLLRVGEVQMEGKPVN